MKCHIFLTTFNNIVPDIPRDISGFSFTSSQPRQPYPIFQHRTRSSLPFRPPCNIYKQHSAVLAPLQEPVFGIGIRECRVQIRGTAFCPCSHLYFGLIALTKFHHHSFPIRRPPMPHIFAFLVRHAIFALAFIRIAHYVRIPAANQRQIAASRSHGAAVQRYAPFAARCSILPHYVKYPCTQRCSAVKPIITAKHSAATQTYVCRVLLSFNCFSYIDIVISLSAYRISFIDMNVL